MSDSPKRPNAKTPPASPTPAPPDAPQGASGETPTPEIKPASISHRKPAMRTQLAPFRVVLHDDERVDMTHVVRSIVELTPLSAPLARDIMLSAHEHGSAQLLVTHLERAELYQELFAGKGLTITIEPAA